LKRFANSTWIQHEAIKFKFKLNRLTHLWHVYKWVNPFIYLLEEKKNTKQNKIEETETLAAHFHFVTFLTFLSLQLQAPLTVQTGLSSPRLQRRMGNWANLHALFTFQYYRSFDTLWNSSCIGVELEENGATQEQRGEGEGELGPNTIETL
jgi:hypothetical protein